jgi:acyl carrier protein
MLSKEAIQKEILSALENINDERGVDDKIVVSLDTSLFGVDAALDSLALVSVIVDVETAISELAGQAISLTDDRAMAQRISPFSSGNALTAYISDLLANNAP